MTARAIVVAALLGLVAGSAAAQRSQATAPTPRLLLEVDGRGVRDGFTAGVGDTIALTVSARDSTGAAMAVTALELTIFDPRMLVIVGRGAEDASIVVRLRALRAGATTLQVRASGLREWLRVDVLSRAGVVEVAALEAAGDTAPVDLPVVMVMDRWFAGGRLNVTAYDYGFGNQTVIAGQWGMFVEGFGGRAFPSGLKLMAGGSAGTLEADSAGAAILVTLVEVYARMEYTFRFEAPVRPVAGFGIGLYRARTSGAAGAGVWNASMFWMLTGGVDYPMSARIVGEARIGTHQLYDVGGNPSGHVASLWVGGVGVRYRF